MIYSAINSSAYYARDSQWGPVAGLGAVAVLAAVSMAVLVTT